MSKLECNHAWIVIEWEKTDRGMRATQLLCPNCNKERSIVSSYMTYAWNPEDPTIEMPTWDGPPVGYGREKS